jgi:hypothetical protein
MRYYGSRGINAKSGVGGLTPTKPFAKSPPVPNDGFTTTTGSGSASKVTSSNKHTTYALVGTKCSRIGVSGYRNQITKSATQGSSCGRTKAHTRQSGKFLFTFPSGTTSGCPSNKNGWRCRNGSACFNSFLGVTFRGGKSRASGPGSSDRCSKTGLTGATALVSPPLSALVA